MAEVPVESHSALMTGATSGLGLACARALLQRTAPPWRLVIASRNPAEGERVAAELNRQSGRQAVEFMRLDLGSLGSVRAVGAALRSRGLRLDALVCNAGLQFTREMRTADGLEASFGVNHLGHFALLDGIKGLLAADARIVVVSSGTHDPRQKAGIPVPRFVDPVLLARPERDASHGFEQDDKPRVVMQRRYSTSKLCNLYFAYELNRQIAGRTLRRRENRDRECVRSRPDAGLGSGPRLSAAAAARLAPRAAACAAVAAPVRQREHPHPGRLGTGPGGDGGRRRLERRFRALCGRARHHASSEESYDEAKAGRLWQVSESLLGENPDR